MAGAAQRLECAVERRDHAVRDARRRSPGRSVPRVLHLAVGQPRGRTHHAAHEVMAPLAPGVVDPDMDRETGPVLAGPERAQIVGQRFRQHGDDPVREIGRIAAIMGAHVERTVRAHVPGDVGDGDNQVPAILVGRVVIRLRPHGIVEVARILVVHGDQRGMAQVLTAHQRRRRRPSRLNERVGRKFRGDAAAVDRDQARRAGRIFRPQPLRHPGLRQSLHLAGQHIAQH